MEIPVIDFGEINGEERGKTMALLHQACKQWGFFQIENHGIDKKLMDKVKQLVNAYYEENLKESFYQSEIARSLEKDDTSDKDWETTFFVWHRPTSNIEAIPNISEDLCKTMNEYIAQLINLAEKLSELMCENLGSKGPSVGTKVAKYPQCSQPERVRGLREHTDAGGIILLLQDDQVPGLEFFKDGKWVAIPPSKNNTIFVNTGDQLEVLSNGRYKSTLHRVLTDKNGSRLSIATFYNPAGDALISPAPKLLYPNSFRFQDYLNLYAATKFNDKGPRFESMKQMANGNNVKQLVNAHYEENLKESFYQSDIARCLEKDDDISDKDWETAFYVWHRPTSNIEEIPNISEDFCKAMNEYIAQLINLAEKLSELMCENLGLEKNDIKKAFSGSKGPCVGTKVAKYPKCSQPERVRGLREHTDAGGIILMLQEDQIPGLEFFKDGKWVPIPPCKKNTIFVNTGDLLEVLTNGRYKSTVHRVMTDKDGSRLSIATFYNPAGDALISPAPKLLYPNSFRFQDYLKLYATTKFNDKGPRFETMKQMANNGNNGFHT
ncbi:hypothetical protein ACLB2K_008766 [Fragaria x ananassa]